MKALCIGHSHMDAAKYAYEQRTPQWEGIELEFVSLGLLKIDGFPLDLETGLLHPVLADAIESAINSLGGIRAVFLWIGGSYQHELSLINDIEPFDLVLPEEPALPINPKSRLLPYSLIKEVLARRSHWKLRLIGSFSKMFDVPVFQFAAPPPIYSCDYIAAYPGVVFQKLVVERGVSPPSFRYKICRLHSEIYATVCSELGVKIIDPPLDMVVNGFLSEKAYGKDSIHANTEFYGHSVLRRLAETLRSIPSAVNE